MAGKGSSADPFLTRATGGMTPKGYEKLVVSSTAIALAAVPAGASLALIYAADADARWRDDGINPTAGNGIPLLDGSGLLYDGSLSAIKFIRQAGTDVTLDISYYA